MNFAYDLKRFDKNEPLLGISNMLGLNDLNVEHIQYNSKYQINKKLLAEHGNIMDPKKLLDATTYSTIMGHLHSFKRVSKSVKDSENSGKTITAYVNGCLCHTDGRVPARSTNNNWTQGVQEVHSYIEKDYFNVIDIPIENGEFLHNGILYTGNKIKDKGEKENV